MTEHVDILRLNFKVVDTKNNLKIKIKIDELLIADQILNTDITGVDVSISETGNFSLCVEGHDNSHISSCVEIESITVNDIELPRHFLEKGSWSSDYQWIWNFKSPIIPWCVNQVRINDQPHPDLFNPAVEENMVLLNEQLDLLEKILKL
jgi:hypothetical protein